jgi:hypothetical protein
LECRKRGHKKSGTLRGLHGIMSYIDFKLTTIFIRGAMLMSKDVPFQETSALRTNALIPVWMLNKAHPAWARLAMRPVVIHIDELGLSMRGQVVELGKTHAVVQPDSFFYLCKCVYVEVCFQYERTIYTLAGRAAPSDTHQGIRFEFDMVARKTMQTLGMKLNQGVPLPLFSAPHPVREEQTKPGESKKKAFRVRHELPPEGIERRKAHRYTTSTPTRITLVGADVVRDCVMLDLSLGGCKLSFENSCAVVAGTRVEVQFLEHGLPLRMAAVVQVCHDANVLGLRFINVSERMQERLQSLILELSEKG